MATIKDDITRWHELEKKDWKHLAETTKAEEHDWKKWQEIFLEEVLKAQEEEKQRSGEIIELSEDAKRKYLLQLIKTIKEIPVVHHLQLVNQFLDDSYRMGPAQPLWEREFVSDIQIFVPNDARFDQIITYTERGKRYIYDGSGFRDYQHARDWVNHHLSRIGLRYDPAKIYLDGTFPGGERIHVIAGPSGYSTFNPLTKEYQFVRCLIISVRRFVSSFTMTQLTEESTPSLEKPEEIESILKLSKWKKRTLYTKQTGGMADQATMDYLRIMVQLGKNHIVAGGTGVGKTTLANALTEMIPKGEVLEVLEESPEMQPQNPGATIRVYQREGTFNLTDALKCALRMFPDRIFVAELRDSSVTYTFLQAIQSGHDGSSTTVHASTCLAAIDRTIDMAAGHESKPSREMLRSVIYDRIHTILHGARDGGSRFFDEVIQLNPDGTAHAVMKYQKVGTDEKGKPVGYFVFNGPTDEFVQEMQSNGIEIPQSWMWEKVDKC